MAHSSVLYGNHVLSTHYLDRDRYTIIIDEANKFKHGDETRRKKNFHGVSGALLFYEPSTRTHSTFVEAVRRYGGRADHGFTSSGSTSVSKGESLEDTIIHYLGLGVNVIIMRHPKDGAARWAADVADEYRQRRGKEEPVVVINGGDGKNQHPTQAIGDIFTIQDELGKGRKAGELNIDGNLDFLAFGDIKYGRAMKSAIEASHEMFGIGNLYLAAHPYVGATEDMVAAYRAAGMNVHVVEKTGDFVELLNGNIDVAYGSRIQEERQGKDTPEGKEKLKKIHGHTRLEKGMIEKPREHMIVMHPQPFNQWNPVITRECKGEKWAVWEQQAENHVFTRAGVLELVLFED